MAKTALKNRYQKAAFKPGDKRVSREQVRELLELATSHDADERLTAATYLCPCHVRGRGFDEWSAVQRLMQDEDPRVRVAAWHTLEDGGVPEGPDVLDGLAALLDEETDPRVKRMAAHVIGPALAERQRRAMTALRRPAPTLRGKCDFCSARDVAVERDYDTMIPTGSSPRPALVCGPCGRQRG